MKKKHAAYRERIIPVSDDASQKRDQRLQSLMNKLAPAFDPVIKIRGMFPNHIIPALEFNKQFATDRRAYGQFVSLEALENVQAVIADFSRRLSRPRAKNWGDLLILYIVDKDPARIVKIQSRLEKQAFKHPRIVIAFPKKTVRITEILLRLTAITQLHEKETNLGDKASWEEMIRRLNAALKAQVRWDKWLWFYMGGYIETEGDLTQSEIISFLLETLYSDIFDPGHKALSMVHTTSVGGRKNVRYAIDKILNFRVPLTITRGDKSKDSEILTALTDQGLLRRTSVEGREETLELNDIVPDNSPAKKVWTSITSDLLEPVQAGREIQFSAITRKYLAEPYSLTPAMLKTLFALIWRYHHEHLTFYNNSGGRVKRVENLTFQRLTDIIRNPDSWQIGLRRIRHDEIPYLRSLLQIFSREKAIAVPPSSLWSETLRIVYQWFDEKPPLLRLKKFSNQHVHLLLETLTKHRSANSPEMFLRHLPAALGFDLKKFDIKYDASLVVESLEFAVKEINEAHAKAAEDISQAVTNQFREITSGFGAITNEEEDDLVHYLQLWLLKSGIKEHLDVLSEQERSLFQLITTAGKNKDRFLERLPAAIGMKPLMRWQDDNTGELVSRLKASFLRVRYIEYLTTFENADPYQRRRKIIEQLLDAFRRRNLSPDAAEPVLEQMIQELSEEEPSK